METIPVFKDSSPPKPRLSRGVLAGFSKVLTLHLGLNYPSERSMDLERGVLLATEMFGFSDAEKCLSWISASTPGQGKIQILARAFTIGETFFFRDRACFSALELKVLPALIAAGRDKGKRLRIWSAGCCTGEEPYSLAMLLCGLLPDWEDWDISILATDINPEFLAKAKAGLYNYWSFRNVEESRKAAYFRETPQGLMELLPKIRKRVNFAYSNLAGAPPEVLFNQGYGLDLILCRNVFMYLTQSCARKAIADFFQLLEEGGWLIVGPTEGEATLFSRFYARSFPNAIFYQKPPFGLPDGLGRESGNASWTQEGISEPATPIRPAIPLAKPADTPTTTHPADDFSALLMSAKTLGNEGNLSAALDSCNQALHLQQLDPRLHYLRALILQEDGNAAEAARSLERGLYLDPKFVMAHYCLGNLASRQGERKKSIRHFRNAARLLRGLPEDQPVPESDGLSVGRLREIMATLAKARQK